MCYVIISVVRLHIFCFLLQLNFSFVTINISKGKLQFLYLLLVSTNLLTRNTENPQESTPIPQVQAKIIIQCSAIKTVSCHLSFIIKIWTYDSFDLHTVVHFLSKIFYKIIDHKNCM